MLPARQIITLIKDLVDPFQNLTHLLNFDPTTQQSVTCRLGQTLQGIDFVSCHFLLFFPHCKVRKIIESFNNSNRYTNYNNKNNNNDNSMNSKEVLVYVKNLQSNKNNDTVILDLLKLLDRELVPTEKLLRETKIGVEVNKFKKSSNAEIAKLVKKMISAWKDTINKNKLKKNLDENKSNSIDNSNNNNNIISNNTADNSKNNIDNLSSIHSPNKNEHKFHSNKPRNSKNDGIITTIYQDKLRDMVIKALYDALCKENDALPNDILKISIDIEKELNKLYNSIDQNKQYKEKYRVIYSNIISKNNPNLKFRIVSNEVTPFFLINCDPKELAPESLRKKIEEIHKKNLFNAQGATIERSVTDRFQCGKCKERKVSYYQLQTRSADEPLTTFCTCEACGNRWKFS